MQQVKKSPILGIGIVLASAAIAGLTFLIPVAETATNPIATHWRTAAGTMIMCLFVGAAIVFLNGLKSFKPSLRSAYRLMAFGILAFSAALIQLVIWGVFDLWESEWAASGSGLVPYVITAALTYAGARKFAKLLEIKGLYTSFWFVIGVSVATLVGMYFLAQVLLTYQLEGADVYIAVGAMCGSFAIFAFLLVLKISKVIGSYYTHAMRWLAIGLGGWLVAIWHETLNTLYFNNGDDYTDYGWYLIPFVIAGLLLVRASYEFRLLPKSNAGSDDAVEASSATDSDYIDSVVAVGSLVSRPAEVEKILNGLRDATAGLQPGTSLTDANKKQIITTYYELEKYLSEKDALRAYTPEELLDYVTPAFRAVLETKATS